MNIFLLFMFFINSRGELKVNSAIRVFILAALSVGMVGCASVSKMPLQSSATTIDTSQRSILVARVRIKNENRPSQQPFLFSMNLTNEAKSMTFAEPTLLSESDEKGKEYFVSMDVAPGKTKLDFMHFIRMAPMIVATADATLNYEIDVPGNKIVYLGNIDAVIVPRTDDSQPRAGSVIPVIDQAVAGFSSGTFKLNITDRYASDTKELISKFPGLAGKQIVKNVLGAKTPQPQAAAEQSSADSSGPARAAPLKRTSAKKRAKQKPALGADARSSSQPG